MLLWVIWVLQLVQRIVPVREYPSNPSGAKERPRRQYTPAELCCRSPADYAVNQKDT